MAKKQTSNPLLDYLPTGSSANTGTSSGASNGNTTIINKNPLLDFVPGGSSSDNELTFNPRDYTDVYSWSNTVRSLFNSYESMANKWNDESEYSIYDRQRSSLIESGKALRNQYNNDMDAFTYINDIIGSLSKADSTPIREYFSQFSGADEYNKYKTEKAHEDDMRSKYGGKNYDQLQGILSGMDSSDEDYKWLSSYAGSEEVMTIDDYDKIIADLESQLAEAQDRAGYTHFDGKNSNESSNVLSIKNELEKYKNARWRVQNKDKYANLSTNADYAEKSKTIDEKLGKTFGISIGDKWYGTGDDVYAYINNLDGRANEYNPDRKNASYAKYDLMTDEERDNYNYLYQTEGKEAADKYLEYISYYLNAERVSEMSKQWSDIADKSPWSAAYSSVFSIPANLMSGAGLIDASLQSLSRAVSGEWKPIDYYTTLSNPAIASQSIRGTVANNITEKYGDVIKIDAAEHPILGKIFNGRSYGELYQLGMSIGDSLSIAYGMGPIGTFLLGGSAGTQGMLQALDNGASDSQAIAMGILNGTFETLFEYVSLDHLLKMEGSGVKAFIKNTLLQGLVEGDEELNTTLFNTIADVIVMAQNSDWERARAEYMSNGMTAAEASRQVLMDTAINMGWDFVGGMLSAVPSTMVQTAIGGVANDVQERKYYKDTYGSSINELLAESLEINPNSSIASKVQGKVSKSQKISGKDIRALVQENEKTLTDNDKSKINSAVNERLTSYGEKGDVSALANAITKRVAGEQLTKAENKLIQDSKYAQRVLNELDTKNIESGEYNTEWAERLGTDRINADEYSKLIASLDTNTETATAEEAQVNPNVANAFNAKNTATAQNTVNQQTAEQKTEAPKAETVKESKPAAETKTEAKADTKSNTEAKATLEEAAKAYGNQAGAFTHTYNEGQNVEDYAEAYKQAFDYGAATVPYESIKNLDGLAYLTDAQRELAYKAGVDSQSKTAEKEDAGNKAARKNDGSTWKTGSVSYNAEYKGEKIKKGGTVKGENVSVKDIEKAFNDKQKVAYKVLARIAEATGINIVLYSSEADADNVYRGVQGMFRRSTPDTIYIDINAGLANVKDMSDAAKYTMLYSFSHEFTHFIEKWNPIRYNELRKVVFEQMTENGADVDALISSKADSQGLEYERASREVVAESLTQILDQQTFVETLYNEHKSLFDKLLEKLREFIDNIKAYFKDANTVRNRDASALMREIDGAVKYTENIVKLFNEVAKEAVDNYQMSLDIEIAETSTDEQTTEPEKAPETSFEDKRFYNLEEIDDVQAFNSKLSQRYNSKYGFSVSGIWHKNRILIEFGNTTIPENVAKILKAKKAEEGKWRGAYSVSSNKFTKYQIAELLDKAFAENEKAEAKAESKPAVNEIDVGSLLNAVNNAQGVANTTGEEQSVKLSDHVKAETEEQTEATEEEHTTFNQGENELKALLKKPLPGTVEARLDEVMEWFSNNTNPLRFEYVAKRIHSQSTEQLKEFFQYIETIDDWQNKHIEGDVQPYYWYAHDFAKNEYLQRTRDNVAEKKPSESWKTSREVLDAVIENTHIPNSSVYPTVIYEENTTKTSKADKVTDTAPVKNKYGFIVRDNENSNGTEIGFDGIPPVGVRDVLKRNGFKWSSKRKVWYNRKTDHQKITAELEQAFAKETETAPEEKPVAKPFSGTEIYNPEAVEQIVSDKVEGKTSPAADIVDSMPAAEEIKAEESRETPKAPEAEKVSEPETQPVKTESSEERKAAEREWAKKIFRALSRAPKGSAGYELNEGALSCFESQRTAARDNMNASFTGHDGDMGRAMEYFDEQSKWQYIGQYIQNNGTVKPKDGAQALTPEKLRARQAARTLLHLKELKAGAKGVMSQVGKEAVTLELFDTNVKFNNASWIINEGFHSGWYAPQYATEWEIRNDNNLSYIPFIADALVNRYGDGWSAKINVNSILEYAEQTGQLQPDDLELEARWAAEAEQMLADALPEYREYLEWRDGKNETKETNEKGEVTNGEETDNGRTVLESESDGEGTSRLLDESQAEPVQGDVGTGESDGNPDERRGQTERDGNQQPVEPGRSGSERVSESGDLRRDEVTPEEEAKHEEAVKEVIEKEIEQKSTVQPKGSNFVFGESLDLPTGAKNRFKANVEAIRLIKKLDTEGRYATAEEQAILSKYVGWGGISEAFGEYKYNYASRKAEFFPKNGWDTEFNELKALVDEGIITEEEYSGMSASTKNAHYTSVEVIKAMYSGLEQLGFKGGRMLEPSSGVGNFVGGMPVNMSNTVKSWTLVELDRITGTIAKYLYPNADMRIQGFEKANIPDNYMDVAIGNVPFGDYGVVDKSYPKRVTSAIHNYFFAKALDKVRPGGIVMFITSSFTLNGKDNSLRQYIMDRADLVGAIRLPNTAFQGNAGTQVVTDILVLKKREAGTEYAGESFLNSPQTRVESSTGNNYDWVSINEYFSAHPEMVLGTADLVRGMYGPESLTYKPLENKGTLGEQITEAFKNISAKMDYKAKPTPEKSNFNQQKAGKKTKNGGLEVKEGKVYRNQDGNLVEVEADAKTAERITGLLGIRDAYRNLVNYQLQGLNEAEIKKARKELNTLYDKFVEKYKYINDPKNRKAIESDPDCYSILALENYNPQTKTATKSDIFAKNTISANRTINHVNDVSEGVIVSINEKGTIDPAYIASLTGKTEEAVTRELIDGRFAFKTRDGALEAPDKYLSGNVRAKLREAESLAPLDSDFRNNVEELKKVIPADIPFNEIYTSIGTPWVPNEVYADFIAYMLGGSNSYGYRDPDVTVGRTNQGAFVIALNNPRLRKQYRNTQEYGTSRRSFLKIMETVMNSGELTVRDTLEDANGKTIKVVNKVETAAVQEKAEAINKEFQEWLWSDEKRRNELSSLYNETFNAFVTPRFSGEHLTVNGINPAFSLRQHQADAIQRIVSSGGNTLLAHKVGAGKTLEMAAAAMKLRELGIVKKPMFAVPKSLVAQWGVEFKSYFPAAKLLVADDKSFSKANRKVFINKIANGDYDAVIVSYEQFGRIPMSTQFQIEFYQEQINEILTAIAEEKAESKNGKGLTVKEMQTRQAQLEKKIAELNSAAKDEDNVDFEQLGVDSLFVDEAHNFKNLFYTTRMKNVSGLGSPDGRKRAFDLYTKVRYLQRLNGGSGIVFATATPVMNSMAEMYIMQKYLQSDLLEQLGLKSFDAWAKQFGEIVNAVEIKPSGQGFRVKQSFSNFRNLNELQMLFRSFSDVLTEVPGLKIPKMRGGQVNTIVCEPGGFQLEYMKQLEARADNIKNVNPKEDNMLKITSDGRKVAYTQRMIDPSLPYETGCKIYRCCDKVLEEYKASTNKTVTDPKTGEKVKLLGTQLIFCDMATPKGTDKKAKEDSDEDTDDNEFDAESAKLYDDIRAYLVKKGIPAAEIAFIHEANTDAKKKKLFADVNDGKVRVLIGSTGKMGVGMNAQRRIVAIHHLDSPWRPGDVEQRDGRCFRQGNLNDEVAKYVYVTEKSFDARMWDILDRKQNFINQIMNGDNVGRTAEDTGNVTLSAAEVKALASGNPLIREQVEISNELQKLQALQKAHQSSVAKAKVNLLADTQKISELTSRIENAVKDIKTRVDTYSDDKFSIKIGNRTYTDKKEAGTALAAAIMAKANKDGFVDVGTFAGFTLKVMQTNDGYTGLVSGAQGYKFNVYPQNTTYMINHIIEVVKGLESKLNGYKTSLEETKADRDAQEKLANEPFSKQKEFNEKTARLNEIMSELNPQNEQAIDDDEADDQYQERDDYDGLEPFEDDGIQYSVRQEAPPKKTKIGYKVFKIVNGQLYPTKVKNPNGAGTPLGIWLNADTGELARNPDGSLILNTLGRISVKASGGTLAWRPGWHLGALPEANQMNIANPNNKDGKKSQVGLMHEDYVFCECEFAADNDYQLEAFQMGFTKNGKYTHKLAGLPYLPQNGYYRYRTNPDPNTSPWFISGAIKITKILDDAQRKEIIDQWNAEHPDEPMYYAPRKGGDLSGDAFYKRFGLMPGEVTTPSEVEATPGVDYSEEIKTLEGYRPNAINWDNPTFKEAFSINKTDKSYDEYKSEYESRQPSEQYQLREAPENVKAIAKAIAIPKVEEDFGREPTVFDYDKALKELQHQDGRATNAYARPADVSPLAWQKYADSIERIMLKQTEPHNGKVYYNGKQYVIQDDTKLPDNWAQRWALLSVNTPEEHAQSIIHNVYDEHTGKIVAKYRLVKWSGNKVSLMELPKDHKGTVYDKTVNDADYQYSLHSNATVIPQVTAGTMLSGGGLVDTALAAVINSMFAVEKAEKIAAIYTMNHRTEFMGEDVLTFDPTPYAGKLQYLHVSPECKTDSRLITNAAKKRRQESNIDVEIAQAIAHSLEVILPEVFTLENVPGYEGEQGWKIITETLHNLGYDFDGHVYKTSDYGGTTIRERYLIRAVKNGTLPPKPEPITKGKEIGWFSVVEDLIGTKDCPETTQLNSRMLDNLAKRGIDINNLSEPILVFGNSYKSGDFGVSYGSKPALTIMAKSGASRIFMPDGKVYDAKPRVLARIMGLPDSYVLDTDLETARKIVGNGVPVQLTQKVFGNLLTSHYGMDFEYQERSSPLTDREVLAIAAQSVKVDDLNEAERDALGIFKNKLEKLYDLETRRAEEGRTYKEQQFGAKVDREAAKQTLERMHILDDQIKAASEAVLKVENAKVMKDVLQKARKVVEGVERAHGEELLKRYRDRRNNSAAIKKYRERIRKDVGDLSKWIIHPDNKNVYKHIPDVVKNSVIPFLESINFTSKRALNGGKQTQGDKAFLENLAKLRNSLKKQIDVEGMYSGYLDLPADFMEDLQKLIDDVNNPLALVEGEFYINRMTAEELKRLSRFVRLLKKLIVNMNSFHNNAMFKHTFDAGDNSIKYMKDMKDSFGTNAVSDYLLWQQIRPAYAFERFGDGGISIYDEFRRGQAQLAFNTVKIKKYAEAAYTEAEVKAWEKEIKTFDIGGKVRKVPVSYLMGLYELVKRPQAKEHIYGNGIRIATYTNGKEKISDTGFFVNIDTLQEMLKVLTPRQIEVADKLQQYMAKQGGEWGNYVSVARFGEEQFGEEHYYPINSDGRHLQANADEAPSKASLYALLNMSFTKDLVEHANNRVVLYSIFDVFANHMASMAQYNAFALPILDSLKWLNYKDVATAEDGSKLIMDSVREEMARAYGVPDESKPGSGRRGYAESFVINIIKAFNGTETQGVPQDVRFVNEIHRYNMAQVAYNIRVVVQQPMAITRAAMLVSYKSLMKGLKVKDLNANAEEAERYSGIAAWKQLGFYDVNISRGLTDIIKHDNSFMDKVGDFGMQGAEFADRITWGAMWAACKAEVTDKQHILPGDEKFFPAVTKLFEDVVYKTQVVDSVLTKNEFLRSKGSIARAVGSFMSEPTTTASMLIDTYEKYQRDMQRGMNAREAWAVHGANIGRLAIVYCISSVMLAASTSIIDAFRDDDDYQSWGQKYMEAFWGNLVDELMPINKLPILRDVYELTKELLRAFGVDTYGNAPRSVIFQWWDTLIKGVQIIVDRINQNDKDKYTWYGGIYKLIQAVSGMTGLPAATAMREVTTIWNNTVGSMAPSLKLKTYDAGSKNNIKYAFKDGYLSEEDAKKALIDSGDADDQNDAYWIVEGWKRGDGSTSNYSKVYEGMLNGDNITAAVNEMKTHGYEEKKIYSQMKSKIGEWYKGTSSDKVTISESQAVRMLMTYCKLNKADANETVSAWKEKLKESKK